MSSQGFGHVAELAPERRFEEQTKPVKGFDSDVWGKREFKACGSSYSHFFSVVC